MSCLWSCFGLPKRKKSTDELSVESVGPFGPELSELGYVPQMFQPMCRPVWDENDDRMIILTEAHQNTAQSLWDMFNSMSQMAEETQQQFVDLDITQQNEESNYNENVNGDDMVRDDPVNEMEDKEENEVNEVQKPDEVKLVNQPINSEMTEQKEVNEMVKSLDVDVSRDSYSEIHSMESEPTKEIMLQDDGNDEASIHSKTIKMTEVPVNEVVDECHGEQTSLDSLPEALMETTEFISKMQDVIDRISEGDIESELKIAEEIQRKCYPVKSMTGSLALISSKLEEDDVSSSEEDNVSVSKEDNHESLSGEKRQKTETTLNEVPLSPKDCSVDTERVTPGLKVEANSKSSKEKIAGLVLKKVDGLDKYELRKKESLPEKC